MSPHYKKLLTHTYEQEEREEIENKRRGALIIITLTLIIWTFIIYAFLSLSSCTKAYADELPSNEKIANAIFHAENSKKFPYGIRSIKTNSELQARKICINSIRNAKKRWVKAGHPGDFIVFMGKHYSPPSINPNWVRLVKHFLAKEA